jgi:asparagine synthase (glutamine-hydrolysing)
VIDALGDADLLGPAARPWFEAHGPVFPVSIFGRTSVYETARGGVLLNGEGGDEVLGTRRVAAAFDAVAQLRRGRRPSRSALSSAQTLVRPRRVTEAEVAALFGLCHWLTPRARAELRPLLEREFVAEPLDVAAALRMHLERKLIADIQRTIRWFAGCHDVRVASPLLDASFAAAIAARARRRDLRDRTTLLERHFADVLPRPIRTRRSKATFGRAFFGPGCRAFAASWDGSGVDPDLVDVAALRDEWSKDHPSGLSISLFLHAWAARARHPD